MNDDTAEGVRSTVDSVYRAESRRVLATLIRLLGSFDLAEEALHALLPKPKSSSAATTSSSART